MGEIMTRKTSVSIHDEAWVINGEATYLGQSFRDWRIEGLLLNSRMVNAIFDDENEHTRFLWHYPDSGMWDPERNVQEFLAAMPAYRAHGLLAMTLNLQGGAPSGYYRESDFRAHLAAMGVEISDEQLWAGVPGPQSQPWHNSTFDATGKLKPPYLDRLTRILDQADALGMVIILGLFYQGQDERLRDEAAVRRAVDNACTWVLAEGYTNVVIEINNECNTRYEHEILQPGRVHELIAQAKAITHEGRRLLVSTSYGGGGWIPSEAVAEVADFLLVHGNGISDPQQIANVVDRCRALNSYTPKPILFNEDDHFGFDQAENNFTAALSRYASWGYFDPGAGAGGQVAFGNYQDGYQLIPAHWGINTARKREFFAFLKRVTAS
jgi:hypothetical protein